MAHFDDTKNGQGAKRLAQGGSADSENLNELAFCRQPVAGFQIARLHQIENSVNDFFGHPLLLDLAFFSELEGFVRYHLTLPILGSLECKWTGQ